MILSLSAEYIFSGEEDGGTASITLFLQMSLQGRHLPVHTDYNAMHGISHDVDNQ